MAKGQGNQTTTSQFDPQTQQYVQQIRDAAQHAANGGGPGVDPLTQQAVQQYQSFAANGQLGARALGGDASALQGLMNPYTQSVVDASMADFDQLRDKTLSGVNSQATLSGALGGTRNAVAQGVALGDINRSAQSQIAGLRSQGYSDAMNRAYMGANLGLGATGALTSLGDYYRNVGMDQNPDLWRLKMLNMGIGPIAGGTQTTTQQGGSNPFTGFLGGAGTGAGIGATWGPWGAGIGGLLGGVAGALS